MKSLSLLFDTEPGRVRVAVRLRPRNAEDLLSDADFADCVELQPEVIVGCHSGTCTWHEHACMQVHMYMLILYLVQGAATGTVGLIKMGFSYAAEEAKVEEKQLEFRVL